jgi:hypothetical protein
MERCVSQLQQDRESARLCENSYRRHDQCVAGPVLDKQQTNTIVDLSPLSYYFLITKAGFDFLPELTNFRFSKFCWSVDIVKRNDPTVCHKCSSLGSCQGMTDHQRRLNTRLTADSGLYDPLCQEVSARNLA